MDLLFFFELLLLGFAVYIYLFSAGFIKIVGVKDRKGLEEWRDNSAKWLRPMSLFLMAIMIVNILLRFKAQA